MYPFKYTYHDYLYIKSYTSYINMSTKKYTI